MPRTEIESVDSLPAIAALQASRLPSPEGLANGGQVAGGTTVGGRLEIKSRDMDCKIRDQ